QPGIDDAAAVAPTPMTRTRAATIHGQRRVESLAGAGDGRSIAKGEGARARRRQGTCSAVDLATATRGRAGAFPTSSNGERPASEGERTVVTRAERRSSALARALQ